MPGPIKRHHALQPLSREHHFGLLFCWKLREGIKKGIEPMRMAAYVQYYWKNLLSPHFEMEERYLFPMLNQDKGLIELALEDHKRIRELMLLEGDMLETIKQLENTLNQHIRFEERTLFNVLQNALSPEQLRLIEETHQEEATDDQWDDLFWE